MRCKNILIFNTSLEAADPIYVIKAEEFGGFNDSDIPVVVGYNQVHYESLHPASQADIEISKFLVDSYIEGSYQYQKKDIPFLISKSNETSGHFPERKQSEQDNNSDEKRHFRGKRTRSVSKQDVSVQNNVYEQLRKQETGEPVRENESSPPQLTKKKNTGKKENRRKEPTEPFPKLRENHNIDKNRFSSLSDIKDKKEECSLSLEDLKLIKGKDRSKSQTSRYKKLMRLKRMEAQTDAQKDQINKRHKERVMKSRGRESLEEKEARNLKNKEATANVRKTEAVVEKEKRNRRNAESMAKSRNRKKAESIENPKSIYMARNAQDVLNGRQRVVELKDSKESIGSMNHICLKCSANKWKGETSSTCCNDGKVVLD